MAKTTHATPKTNSRPKRLSLSEILELVLTRSSDRSVVALTRNAKGETQIEVQVKASESSRVSSIDAAKDAATEAFKTLRGRFPLSDGTVGGGASRD